MTLRDTVLSRLELGGEHSGQTLAEELGVSRTAVWKAIVALREEDYVIESTTKRGYRLSDGCDMLSEAGIRAYLHGDVDVHAFGTLDSTNSEAKRILASGSDKPFLVVCDQQTGGRGRRGRSFYSPKGAGLYMTLALTRQLALSDALGVTAFTAVTAARVIERETQKSPRIKWVNDLYLGSKKICGVLTEAVTDVESGTVNAILIGVGVNVHPTDVPDELRDVIGFLDPAGRIRNRLAAALTDALLGYDPARPFELDEYKRRSCVLGHSVRFERNGVTMTGKALDIDEAGGLIVDTDAGRQVLRSGEISLRVTGE